MTVKWPSENQDIHNWGFVGTSSISATVAQQVQTAGVGRLTAVASRDLNRAQLFAKAHGFTKSYADYHALLADPDINAVYIALPHSLHAQTILQALSAGKHVLCEKPLAMSAQEVETVMAHPRVKDLVVAEGFMVRHHPQWQWIEGAIKSRLIGKVCLFESFFCLEQTPTSVEFDLMLDLGCYAVHFARLAFQEEPLAVSAYSASKNLIGASLYFPSGIAHIAQSTATASAGRVHIVGSHGSIELFNPVHGPDGVAKLVLSTQGNEPERRTFGPALQYALEFLDVSRAINSKSLPRVSLSDALSNARCLDAIRSAANRVTVAKMDNSQ